jgi:hypothetical protein
MRLFVYTKMVLTREVADGLRQKSGEYRTVTEAREAAARWWS